MNPYQSPVRKFTKVLCTAGVSKIIGYLSVIILLASCDPAKKINKDYLYFQNDRRMAVKAKVEELTIKPKDLLAIQIYSNTLKQEDAAIFNIVAGQGYMVDERGQIEIPVVGQIVAAGLTRDELQKAIRLKLNPYVKDPSVVVRFQQFTINVLGDVNSPGTKVFAKEQVTILDAIGAAGDLAPTGVRENVTVIRDNNGVKQLFEIDLRSAALFESQVYQLQQNDIVYVNANKTKLKALSDKPNVLNIVQTAFSFVGIATSLILLFSRN
jgi:polysaccharide export outer membrane protein